MRSLDINPEPLLMFNDFLVIYIQLCEVEIPILVLLHFIQTVMAIYPATCSKTDRFNVIKYSLKIFS